jgi:hypothetical protein
LFLRHSSIDGLKIEQREPVVLRTGSFLASYEPGVVNYNVDACRSPSSLGHVEVLITIVKNDGERRISMRTIV